MSGHIWKAITNIVDKLKTKPKKVIKIAISNCCNPARCRTPIKCFDKDECLYGKKTLCVRH